MPNWCGNEVTIVFDEQSDYDKFITQMDIEDTTDHYLSSHSEDKGYGFFDRLVPTPQDKLDDGGWYDWRVSNWGTKWNPNIQMFLTDDEGLSIQVVMDTAWAPPIEFFKTFTLLFPSAKVQLNYVEEGMQFCGRAYFEDGGVDDKYINEIPTEMYVKAGATLNSEGDIDWDADQDYDLWEIVNNEDQFVEFVK